MRQSMNRLVKDKKAWRLLFKYPETQRGVRISIRWKNSFFHTKSPFHTKYNSMDKNFYYDVRKRLFVQGSFLPRNTTFYFCLQLAEVRNQRQYSRWRRGHITGSRKGPARQGESHFEEITAISGKVCSREKCLASELLCQFVPPPSSSIFNPSLFWKLFPSCDFIW